MVKQSFEKWLCYIENCVEGGAPVSTRVTHCASSYQATL